MHFSFFIRFFVVISLYHFQIENAVLRVWLLFFELYYISFSIGKTLNLYNSQMYTISIWKKIIHTFMNILNKNGLEPDIYIYILYPYCNALALILIIFQLIQRYQQFPFDDKKKKNQNEKKKILQNINKQFSIHIFSLFSNILV